MRRATPSAAARRTLGAVAALLLLAFATAQSEWTWAPAEGTLLTRWAADVDPSAPLPEYPRPQLVRDAWLNLNGPWAYAIRRGSEAPAQADGTALVPFPIESALSGVGARVAPDAYLWLERSFLVPEAWRDGRVLLHFGAVDWEATVWVNGRELGSHRGGYTPFHFDITDALVPGAEQHLRVRVFDPTDAGDQPHGKQVLRPGGIWYTPVTGIWQTVWLEPVPHTYVQGLRMTPSYAAGTLALQTHVEGDLDGITVRAIATVDGTTVARAAGPAGGALELSIDEPRGWSPSDPFLYDLTVELWRGDLVVDRVESYFGLRDVRLADVGGVTRILLNGEPLFQYGTLDQGYWPDGLYTAPTDEALRFDLDITKAMGMNLVRKHVKVEPARWYAHADRIGLLVWQDMPNGGPHVAYGQGELSGTPPFAAQFERELFAMVDALHNHPSVISWVIFNEGWGQHDTVRLTDALSAHDPSRLINSASGWNDMGSGDILDIHWYTGPGAPAPSAGRASVLGEFGGFGLPVLGHTSQDVDNWGYDTLSDPEVLASAYESALERLWPLIADPGLAAAVYTQLTDVESEVNGLLTYDREVLKIDLERLQVAHAALFRTPPQRLALVPTSEVEAQLWRFTTTAPTEGWAGLDYDDRDWTEGEAGFGHGYVPGAHVRSEWSSDSIWLRRTFEFSGDPRELSNLTLRVHHDDAVDLYVNGVAIVSLPFYTQRYVDVVRDEALRNVLRTGTNVLAARNVRGWGGQYIDIGLYALHQPPEEAP